MHALRAMLAFAVLALLPGCPQEVAPMAPVDMTPAPTGPNVIHGRATYRERIKIPPGAAFTVQLIDHQLADTQNAVIATTTLHDVAGPPYDFALQYDPAKIRANGRYGLNATLRGADGGLLFSTHTPIPVTIGDANPVEFRMVRNNSGDAPRPASQLERTHWTCGGTTFEAVFDIPGGRVDLALPEGAMSLPLAISASGARYVDHRGNEFWTKGRTGTFTRARGKKVDCVQADAPPTASSPWDNAKARGIAFRAVGNEPGWFVEIGKGDTPMLHAELDYGARKLDAQVRMLSGVLGYAGSAQDGTTLRLVLERKACTDGMSDQAYPVDARFDVGGKGYRGCGRFLE